MKKIIWWSISALLALLIFIFSSQPGHESSEISSGLLSDILALIMPNASTEQFEFFHTLLRKASHFSVYLFLGIAIRNLVKCYQVAKPLTYTLLFCIAYAASDEFHQIFVPGRSAQLTDVGIDFAGSLVGVFILYGVEKLFRRISR